MEVVLCSAETLNLKNLLRKIQKNFFFFFISTFFTAKRLLKVQPFFAAVGEICEGRSESTGSHSFIKLEWKIVWNGGETRVKNCQCS